MTCQGSCYAQLLSIQPFAVHPAYSQYFRDNTPVPDEQTFQILGILDAASSHLSFIDSQVQRVQQVLDHLLLVKERQTQFVSRHKSMVSTFRQLPNEILGEIVRFCVLAEQKDDSRPFVGDVSKDVRWKLSAVCSRWRRLICYGMPELWASISIENASLRDADKSRVDTVLQTCLDRSGPYPLSIQYNLFASRWFRGVMPVVDRKCMELIKEESMRWREMTLVDFPLEEVLGSGSPYGAAIENRIPLLQRLTLTPSAQPQRPSNSCSITAFSLAPNLRHARIFTVPRPVVILPWTQLFSYEAEHDMHGILYVLGVARHLEKYVALEPKTRTTPITDSHPLSLSIPDPLSEPLSHPSLQTLSLSGSVVPVLAHLSLPALTTLRISGMDTRHFHILTQFLMRNYGNAKHILKSKDSHRSAFHSYTSRYSDDEAFPSAKLDTLQISVSIGPSVPLDNFVRAAGVADRRRLDLYGPGHFRVNGLLKALTVPSGSRFEDLYSDASNLSPSPSPTSSGSSSPSLASLPSSTSSSPSSQASWPPRLWANATNRHCLDKDDLPLPDLQHLSLSLSFSDGDDDMDNGSRVIEGIVQLVGSRSRSTGYSLCSTWDSYLGAENLPLVEPLKSLTLHDSFSTSSFPGFVPRSASGVRMDEFRSELRRRLAVFEDVEVRTVDWRRWENIP